MYALRSRGSEARFGKLCIILGTVVLFAFLFLGLISAMGSIDWAVGNIERILDLLGTPLGVGLGFAASVFLILLGLAFLLFFAPSPPQTISSSEEDPITETPDVSAWDDPEFKFTVVNKETFRNESVPLDGRLYTNCTFGNVTFIYKGEAPYGLVNPTILGKDTTVKAEGAALWAYSRLLNVLGYINREIEKGDELRPDATFVRIEDGRIDILESKDEEDQRIRKENEQLKAERDALREEKQRDVRTQRRTRIMAWRHSIKNFDFESTDKFSGTDTYSQMRPYLRPEVVKIFESRMAWVPPEGRGGDPFRYTLLDEVTRIEREWELA